MRTARSRRLPSLRVIAALSVLLLAFALAACGGADEKKPAEGPPANFANHVRGAAHAPALAAQDYVTDLNEGDGAGICNLTQSTKKGFAQCSKVIAASFDARAQTEYKLLSAKLDSKDAATVRLHQVKPKLKAKAPQTSIFKLEK